MNQRKEVYRKKFDELTLTQLFEIVRARFTVFVGEQHILEPEYDDIDYKSIHLFIPDGDAIIAYARLFRGDAPGRWMLGRMLTVQRKQGLGAAILRAAIEYVKEQGGTEILLHAQLHAKGFYAHHGFQVCSDVFEEAGIPHVLMSMATGRIYLRPWLESDAAVLYQYASDPEVGPRAGWPPHKSVEESLEVIRTVFNDVTCTWAIVLSQTGEPIGAMGYGPSCECRLPAREGEPLIGYWVARPYWNQGICTEALQLMIDHIRETTDIRSLISGHFIDNPASGRVMEKCGFIPTGETVVDPDQGRDTPIRVLRLALITR